MTSAPPDVSASAPRPAPGGKGVAALLRAPVAFVTGKGGVGKSTVAAGLAVAFARRGERVSLVEFDDDEAGKRSLRGADAPVAHTVVAYSRALEDAIAPLVGGALVARTLLRHSAVQRLMKAMPSLREFVSLEKVRTLVASGQAGRVVVDLPASGHAIDWLRVPGAFERFLAGGPLGSLGRRVNDEVIATGRSDIVLVTVAEPLVVRETRELALGLHAELGRGPALLVVNRASRPDPSGALEAAARLAAAAPGEPSAAVFERLLRERAAVASEAYDALKLARGLDSAPVISLPEAPADPAVTEVVRWLDEGSP